MESLKSLKTLLQKNEYMWKLDLQDAYLYVPLSKEEQKRVTFRWEGALYQFLCLCFDLSPAPYVLTKLLKIPTALSRRIGTPIVIFLDDMLIIGRTWEETIALRDKLFFYFTICDLLQIRKSL